MAAKRRGNQRGFISPDRARDAIFNFEERADELREGGSREAALALDMIANELRNQLAGGWGKGDDQRPFEISFSGEPTPDGMYRFHAEFGRRLQADDAQNSS